MISLSFLAAGSIRVSTRTEPELPALHCHVWNCPRSRPAGPVSLPIFGAWKFKQPVDTCMTDRLHLFLLMLMPSTVGIFQNQLMHFFCFMSGNIISFNIGQLDFCSGARELSFCSFFGYRQMGHYTVIISQMHLLTRSYTPCTILDGSFIYYRFV